MPNERLNEEGVTLIEMLIAFSIFIIIVSFFPILFKLIQIDSTGSYEVDLFFQQAVQEIRTARNVSAVDNKLFIELVTGKEVQYERFNNLIRRRVDGMGHEVILQNIYAVHYSNQNHGILIKVTDLAGNEYIRRISLAPVVLGGP